jgi:hypothetical protein
MTLPEFAYSFQHHYGIPNYSENLAERILSDLQSGKKDDTVSQYDTEFWEDYLAH